MFSSIYDKRKRGREISDESKLPSSAVSTSRKKKKKKRSRSESNCTNNDVSKAVASSHTETSQKKDRGFDRPRKKPKRGPPSSEALELSKRLTAFSRNKNLSAALQLYKDKSYSTVIDCHHAGIIVDCCAKCGNILVSYSFFPFSWRILLHFVSLARFFLTISTTTL